MAEGVTRRAPLAPGVVLRFRLLLGVLAGVAVAAAAALLLGGSSGPARTESAWSSWRPSGDGVEDAQDIANHVAPRYRLSQGRQLVIVKGGPLELANLPVTLAVSDESQSIRILSGKGVLYQLCGLGPRCAISVGRPSEERHLLLRRESLELALYTFRYLDDVDNIVALLPPPKGKRPSQALLFQREDLKRQLDRPLAATLSEPVPTVREIDLAPDTAPVDALTSRRLFQFDVTQGPDATLVLVLAPLPR